MSLYACIKYRVFAENRTLAICTGRADVADGHNRHMYLPDCYFFFHAEKSHVFFPFFSFAAGSFVIGLILVPSTMSAPNRSPQQRRPHPQQAVDPFMPTGPLYWENPCGGQLTFDGSGAGGTGAGHDPMMMEADSTTRREEEIIGGIVQSARQALEHAEQFAGSYVSTLYMIRYNIFHCASCRRKCVVAWRHSRRENLMFCTVTETTAKCDKFRNFKIPRNRGQSRLCIEDTERALNSLYFERFRVVSSTFRRCVAFSFLYNKMLSK